VTVVLPGFHCCANGRQHATRADYQALSAQYSQHLAEARRVIESQGARISRLTSDLADVVAEPDGRQERRRSLTANLEISALRWENSDEHEGSYRA
jgi:hypothetical protein